MKQCVILYAAVEDACDAQDADPNFRPLFIPGEEKASIVQKY